MTTQALALITVTDKDALGAYREKAPDALARHGGSVVRADPEPVVLETAGDRPNIAALLSFPSAEAAQAWINDPDLADVHALRNKGGKSTIVVIPN
ncbi:DUF1330 domain-containing protein [Labrenzia sp. PHM005]|uniref:DUF1330 domain-containing protein n=1 Tax=Stappiaceae TaxID=2821832 RepID=UPI00114086BE|nr:DUF1330 domain-containing protein [Labrenzia sp. PHM005]QDG78374.1 DUF1330 domain-containing protein [Labrenzia sp. PHM005]